jgi:hypothetical protein
MAEIVFIRLKLLYLDRDIPAIQVYFVVRGFPISLRNPIIYDAIVGAKPLEELIGAR